MTMVLLLNAFLKKEWINFQRYFFNSIGGLVTMYVIFLLLFMGYRGLAGSGPNFGELLEGMLVGYILWVLALVTYQDVTYTIQREAREGTLEQLYMSVHGFGRVIAAHVAASLVINLIVTSVLLLIIMLTTGRWLNLDLVSLLPLILTTLLGILGLGFALGGITLVFKRIESYLQIVQFALIFLVVAPAEEVLAFRFLPASWGADMIREVMVEGRVITDFSGPDFLWLIGGSLAYLAIGLGIYQVCERVAMNRGTIGHY